MDIKKLTQHNHVVELKNRCILHRMATADVETLRNISKFRKNYSRKQELEISGENAGENPFLFIPWRQSTFHQIPDRIPSGSGLEKTRQACSCTWGKWIIFPKGNGADCDLSIPNSHVA